MIKRHSHLLNEFSRQQAQAKLVQQLRKSRKSVAINANGTSGYKITEGKNAGKVLNHLKNKTKTI